MDLVVNDSIENIVLEKKESMLIKQSKGKSFFNYFLNEFNTMQVLKDLVNLGFAYGITKYVVYDDSANIVTYAFMGIVFFNLQNAIMKFLANKNL